MKILQGHDVLLLSDGKPIAQFTTHAMAAEYLARNAAVLPKPRFTEVGERPDPCWITAEGRVLAMAEIDDQHLLNILNGIGDGRFHIRDKAVWDGLEALAVTRGFEAGRASSMEERVTALDTARDAVADQDSAEMWEGLAEHVARESRSNERPSPLRRQCRQCDEILWVAPDDTTTLDCAECQAKLANVRASKATVAAKAVPESKKEETVLDRFQLIELE